ncbi:MAG: SPOR domain-containing protein [Gammaproteobacteria bacterium]|nr:SPOR domain-containing protein [Gammaproteobacteria bacterium]
MSDYDADQLARLDPPYVARYGLTSAPFSDASAENFTYLDAERLQRLNMLQHLTQYSELLLIITGEKGVGKTTLLDCFVRDADEETAICQVDANPMMDADRLLATIAENYQLKDIPQDPAVLQEKLYHFLAQMHHQNKNPVLVIDDAHALPQDALETLFNLADAEASDGNLLRIILFSDPQIETMLDSPEIQRMRERVTHTMDIPALTEEQTIEYVRHRLTAAGLQGGLPFSNKELKKIYHNSSGIPARINECAHLILNGSSLDQAVKDFHVPHSSRFSKKQLAGFLAITVVVALGIFFQKEINNVFEEENVESSAVTTESSDPSVVNEIEQSLTENDQKEEKQQSELSDVLPELAEAPVQDSAAKTEDLELLQREIKQDIVTATQEASKVLPIETLADKKEIAAVEKTEPEKPVLTILSIKPDPVPASRKSQTISIQGSGFTSQSKVRVYWAGRSKLLPAKQFKFVNESMIEINIAVGAKADTWKVRISDPSVEKPVQANFKVAVVRPAPAKKIESATAGKIRSPNWISSQNPDHFTLQLLGSHDRASVQAFVKKHKLKQPHEIVKTLRKGQAWYVLVYESYDSKALAQEASNQLSKSIRGLKPWVRPFAQIQTQMLPVSKTRSALPAKIVVDSTPPFSQSQMENVSWLWTQDPAHYTLQLMNSQQEVGVKQYIVQHKLQGKAVYYRSIRNGQTRYIITYGNYPSREAARQAIKSLSATLQRNQPWVRSFGSVHADLNSH